MSSDESGETDATVTADRRREMTPGEAALLDTEAAAGGSGDRVAERPTRIGRYTVLEEVGRGGMGTVYAAHDPELDRRVALKVLHADRSHRGRLLREAQAMARLNHANVVAVHEIGTHEDEVFVAMEFVEGKTLRRWAQDASPSWREVIAVGLQAARGLAAAHRAGLVHRDFKPDNVMVGAGDDGRGVRARVLDFGIAHHHADEDEAGDAVVEERSLGSGLSGPRLTATGALVGTPAYMAPEQHRGDPTDARTDQFAFCVSMWELLFDGRPFGGDTLPALVASVEEGRIEVPARGRVPKAIVAALRRGLSVRAEDRHRDMAALIRELEVRRVPWAVGAVGLTVLAGVSWAAWPGEVPATDTPSSDRGAASAAASEALAIALAPTSDERLERAEAFLRTHGDADPGLATIAHAAVGRILALRSCPRGQGGPCIEYRPPVEAPPHCREGLRGEAQLVARTELIDRARKHLEAARDGNAGSLRPGTPEHDAFVQASASARVGLADLQFEAFVGSADRPAFFRALAGDDKGAFRAIVAARGEALTPVVEAYVAAAGQDPHWSVVADARAGLAFASVADEIIATALPPGVDDDENLRLQVCDAIHELVAPFQRAAVEHLERCAETARKQERAEQYVELCASLIADVDRMEGASLRATMRANGKAFRACYHHAIRDGVDRGEVRLAARIQADGTPKDVRIISDTLRHDGATSCMVDAMAAIEFPRPQPGRAVDFEYPLEFSPG
ncbi:MAG: protein kinase [Myxococcota bacterium]